MHLAAIGRRLRGGGLFPFGLHRHHAPGRRGGHPHRIPFLSHPPDHAGTMGALGKPVHCFDAAKPRMPRLQGRRLLQARPHGCHLRGRGPGGPAKLSSEKGRALKTRRFYTFALLVVLLSWLQGCSLLFIAKGKSSISTSKIEKVPEAASLEKRMSQRVVLHYKVQEGDTLDFVAQAYYGDPGFTRKIAKDNRLNP